MIEQALNFLQTVSTDLREVGFLGEVSPDKSDGVLHRSPLPAVIGMAEIGSGSKDAIDAFMFDVLGSVIIRNGSPHMRGMAAETTVGGLRDFRRSVLRQFGQVDIPGGSLQANANRFLALS